MTKIKTDPKILGGKPHIAKTRISVDFILNLLESGMEMSEILQEYPHLEKQDIQAAVSWAKNAVEKEKLIFFEQGAFAGRISFA